MRGVTASIHLAGILPDETGELLCVMFNAPDVFIHGTRAQLLEFARQIAKGAGSDGI